MGAIPSADQAGGSLSLAAPEGDLHMEHTEKIDLSMLKGHQVLNIDSDVEGTFLTSCAGGVTAESHKINDRR